MPLRKRCIEYEVRNLSNWVVRVCVCVLFVCLFVCFFLCMLVSLHVPAKSESRPCVPNYWKYTLTPLWLTNVWRRIALWLVLWVHVLSDPTVVRFVIPLPAIGLPSMLLSVALLMLSTLLATL